MTAANRAGLQAARQMTNLIPERFSIDSPGNREEIGMIEAELHAVMRKVHKLGDGDIARGVVRGIPMRSIPVMRARLVQHLAGLDVRRFGENAAFFDGPEGDAAHLRRRSALACRRLSSTHRRKPPGRSGCTWSATNTGSQSWPRRP